MRINVWRDWTGKPCFRDKVTGACEATLRFSNSNVFSSCVFTARQRSCGKVMFSVVCVCHSDCLSKGDPHVTITHDALGLTVQDPPWPWPPTGYQIWDPWPQTPLYWHLVANIVETCSNLFTWGSPGSNTWWWPLKHIPFPSGVCILLECFLVIHVLQCSQKTDATVENLFTMAYQICA